MREVEYSIQVRYIGERYFRKSLVPCYGPAHARQVCKEMIVDTPFALDGSKRGAARVVRVERKILKTYTPEDFKEKT